MSLGTSPHMERDSPSHSQFTISRVAEATQLSVDAKSSPKSLNLGVCTRRFYDFDGNTNPITSFIAATLGCAWARATSAPWAKRRSNSARSFIK